MREHGEPHNFEKAYPPTLLLEDAANDIYRQPHRAHEYANTFHQELKARYQSMTAGAESETSSRLEYLQLRGPWNALMAPIIHAIEIEVLREILPFTRANRSPITREHVESDQYDYLLHDTYDGRSRAILRATNTWVITVAEWFFEEVSEDPRHWCHPILEALAVYHPLFREAEANVKQEGYIRPANPIDAIFEVLADSSATALAVLDPLLEHRKQHDLYWPLESQQQWLLEKNEEIGWAASVGRSFLATCLGRPDQPQTHQPFAPPSEENVWGTPTLRNGPWPVPRYCPAQMLLRSPFEDGRAVVDVATQGCLYRRPRPKGYTSAAELRLNTITRLSTEVERMKIA